PEWHADQELKEERGERELQRVRHALEDHRRRAAVVEDGLAEVEMQRAPEPVEVLKRQRIVEVIGVAERLDIGRGEVLGSEGVEPDRVTGRESRDREDDDVYPEECRDRI